MKKSLLLVFLFSATVSCKKKDPNPPCGCNGAPFETVVDELAVKSSDRGLISINGKKVFSPSCNPEFIEGKLLDRDTVIISGSFHYPCLSKDVYTLIAVPPSFRFTSIRKK